MELNDRRLSDRFWSKVRMGEAPIHYPELGPCFLWVASLTLGYGRFYWKRKDGSVISRAHIVSFEAANGRVPKGYVLDHLCRIKHCVRDSHLEVVTQRTNLMRAPTSIVAIAMAKTHCPQGHSLIDAYVQKGPHGLKRKCSICVKQRSAKARGNPNPINKRRCSICRELGHRLERCPRNPLRVIRMGF